MQQSVSSKAIRKHVIHDESNSSVGLEDATVHRQLSVTREEYRRKLAILKDLTNASDSSKKEFAFKSSAFKSFKVEQNLDNRFEVSFFTKDLAVLKVSLTSYGDSKFYFGTMGSPIKIMTGQNLVEVAENSKVAALALKLGCSLFEARSIYGFTLIRGLVKEVLGLIFYTQSEVRSIKAREISVYSVGFATYVDFGLKRDSYFHLLACLSRAKVYVAGDSFGLDAFLGVQAKSWRMPSGSEGWQGINTGVVIQKKIHGSIACKQMLYLKDEEVLDKAATSGRLNKEMLDALDAKDSFDIRNRLVRIDNIFYKEYLKVWLRSLDNSVDWASKSNITIKDVAPLFEDPQTIRRMTRVMSCELGIRTLLFSPTLDRIQALIDRSDSTLSVSEKALLSEWRLKETTVEVYKKGEARRLFWDSVLLSDSKKGRIEAKNLYVNQFIDVTVPYEFYVFLNEVRGNLFLSMRDRKALSQETLDYKGSDSLASEAPRIKAEVKVKVVESIQDLRVSLGGYMGVPLGKKEALANLLT